jgi:hypothetical protein
MENQPEKQTPPQPEITAKESILQLIFADGKSMFDKKEAQDKVSFLLDMLTDNQCKEVEKKLKRCIFYISKIIKGVSAKKARSFTKMRFGIHKVVIYGACEPCEERIKNMPK